MCVVIFQVYIAALQVCSFVLRVCYIVVLQDLMELILGHTLFFLGDQQLTVTPRLPLPKVKADFDGL